MKEVGIDTATFTSESEAKSAEFVSGDEVALSSAVRARAESSDAESASIRDEKMPSGQEYDVQETIAILVEYYGDQQFDYFGRKGTITQILDLCPAIEFVLAQGPQAVMEWLEPYKVTIRSEENTSDDEKAGEAHPVDDGGSKEQDAPEAKPVSVKPVVEKEAPSKKQSDASPSVAPRLDQKPAQPTPVPDVQRVKAEVIAVPVLAAALPFEKNVPVVNVERLEDSKVNERADVERNVEIPKQDESDVVASTELLDEEPLLIENASDKIELADFIDAPDTDDEDAAVDSLDSDEVKELVEAEYVATIADAFDTWKELAENEEPLETFLVTVVEDLRDSEQGANEYRIDAGEDFDEAVLEQKALPELQAMLIEVRSVKYAIRQLYSAQTKEECDTHVDEVVVTLARLLRNFGYDNPEKMIRDFLKAHPLMSLQELVDELEKTLQQSIYFEALRQKQQSHQKRHSALGKLVFSVLQALSLKNPVADASV